MPINLSVDLQGQKPEGTTQRVWNEAVRKGLREAGRFWVRNYLPIHFTVAAIRRYEYPPITQKYLRKKLRARRAWDRSLGIWVPRQPGHIPLVWTGAMRNSLLQRSVDSFNYQVTATASHGTLKIPLNVQSGGGAPRLYGTRTVWEPLVKVSPEEETTLGRVILDNALLHLQFGGWS
jgi:hypothetical protein